MLCFIADVSHALSCRLLGQKVFRGKASLYAEQIVLWKREKASWASVHCKTSPQSMAAITSLKREIAAVVIGLVTITSLLCALVAE